MKRSLYQWFVTTVALCALCIGVFMLVPLRWDVQSLLPVLPFADPDFVPHGRDVVFVSNGDDYPRYQYGNWGGELTSYPDAQSAWLLLEESYSEHIWGPSVILLDKQGAIWSAAQKRERLNDASAWPEIESLPSDPTFVYLDPEVWQDAVVRLPWLGAQKNLNLKEHQASRLGGFSLGLSVTHIWRLFLWAGGIVAIMYAVYLRLIQAPSSTRWAAIILSFPMSLAAQGGMLYLMSFIWPHMISAVMLLFLFVALVCLCLVPEDRSRLSMPSKSRIFYFILALSVFVILTLISMFQRNLDADLFNHWLWIARHFYGTGTHSPGDLYVLYGVGNEMQYPLGFPILISTCLWLGNVSHANPIALGDTFHLAMFFYRLLLALFSFALVALFYFWGKQLLRSHAGAVFYALCVCALAPVLLGRPAASEVYLAPFVAYTVLSFAFGWACNSAVFFRIGILLSGYCLFLKNEVILILPFLILPWYLPYRIRNRKFALAWGIDALCFAIGALPYIFWKYKLSADSVLSLKQSHFVFESFSISTFFDRHDLFFSLLGEAARVLLEHNIWHLFFILLPLAAGLILYRSSKENFACLLAPIGIISFLLIICVIYVFSLLDPIEHLKLSYYRLHLASVLVAWAFLPIALINSKRS